MEQTKEQNERSETEKTKESDSSTLPKHLLLREELEDLKLQVYRSQIQVSKQLINLLQKREDIELSLQKEQKLLKNQQKEVRRLSTKQLNESKKRPLLQRRSTTWFDSLSSVYQNYWGVEQLSEEQTAKSPSPKDDMIHHKWKCTTCKNLIAISKTYCPSCSAIRPKIAVLVDNNAHKETAKAEEMSVKEYYIFWKKQKEKLSTILGDFKKKCLFIDLELNNLDALYPTLDKKVFSPAAETKKRISEVVLSDQLPTDDITTPRLQTNQDENEEPIQEIIQHRPVKSYIKTPELRFNLCRITKKIKRCKSICKRNHTQRRNRRH